jgi:hypothetical protein
MGGTVVTTGSSGVKVWSGPGGTVRAGAVRGGVGFGVVSGVGVSGATVSGVVVLDVVFRAVVGTVDSCTSMVTDEVWTASSVARVVRCVAVIGSPPAGAVIVGTEVTGSAIRGATAGPVVADGGTKPAGGRPAFVVVASMSTGLTGVVCGARPTATKTITLKASIAAPTTASSRAVFDRE